MNYLKLKKVWNIIGFFLAVGTFIIFIVIIETSKKSECEKAMEYYSTLSFKGLISGKFIDRLNHGESILKINVLDSIVLFRKYFDQSGLYEYCQIGDSIKKNKESLKVIVIRNSKKKTFIIDFNCDKL